MHTPPREDSFKELVWKKVKVRKSLDQICHTLELEMPYSEREKIRRHDKIEVRYCNPNIKDSGSSRLLTTVFVDEITGEADAKRQNLFAVGRSPARDIIDSTWSDIADGRQNLEYITKQIAGKFGITVARFSEEETTPVFSFSWGEESPWVKLLEKATEQGFILTSNEMGNLYLWKIASTARREDFRLTEGRNIQSIRTTENGAYQFHTYRVVGGRQEAVEIDSTCKSNRILTVTVTDPFVDQLALERRARTEKLRRQEIRTIVEVPGWGLDDAQIKRLGPVTAGKEIFWNPNFLIPVKMPSLNLNKELLISEVEYTADTTSIKSSITLVNKEQFS